MFFATIRASLFVFAFAAPFEAQPDAIAGFSISSAAPVKSVATGPLLSLRKDYSLRLAYKDVFEILADSNICSDFYGGPAVATTVLNQFIMRVERSELSVFISFQMAGRDQKMLDLSSGAAYRLFDYEFVNSEGAFYQRRFDPKLPRPPNVGSFLPGTRPARALILMHELAHLIKRPDGSWLIPNDGNDSRQSTLNTAQVERRCAAELKALE
jgi:hypothetical protein